MKGYHLPREKGGRPTPGYPKAIDQGSSQPEGYQKENRAHKPSKAGTMIKAIKRNQ